MVVINQVMQNKQNLNSSFNNIIIKKYMKILKKDFQKKKNKKNSYFSEKINKILIIITFKKYYIYLYIKKKHNLFCNL